MTQVHVLTVAEPGERLDRYLAARFADLSRSAIQGLIRQGDVLVNGAETKSSYVPLPGDVIRIEIPPAEPARPQAEPIPLDILYEDEYLLVLNKPAGLVVHPGAGRRSGTLVNALLARHPEVADAGMVAHRPGIVHRLDRDTSGAMVVALRDDVQQALQRQFKAREVTKVYLALLHGHLEPERGAIEAPIGRDPQHRTRMAVLAEGGRYARTEYRVRRYLSPPPVSWTQVRLLTGRTHQIRVHLRSIGHPVVGDRVYGYRREAIDVPRQLLHAWRLGFRHPVTGEEAEFEAPLPDDIRDVLDRWDVAL